MPGFDSVIGRSTGNDFDFPLSGSQENHPDRLILTASHALIALEQEVHQTFETAGIDDVAQCDLNMMRARIYDEEASHFDCLCARQATTLDGLRAKANSLVAWSPGIIDDAAKDRTSLLLAALVSDILKL